jgi:D-galactose 1-dehydrogenase
LRAGIKRDTSDAGGARQHVDAHRRAADRNSIMSPLRIAIVGYGKIARDRHVPAITATEAVMLSAIADPNTSLSGVPHAATLEELLRNGPPFDAVALCNPPQLRRDLAAMALAAGKHVMLEKPPGATLSEIGPLLTAAVDARRTLFATWHSRFAPAVEPARQMLANRRITAVRITWKEDVRVWHPGQAWIWQPGGLGVFDPGINALSILTRILPQPLFVTSADLAFPANCDAPIAATLGIADAAGLQISAEFDFRQTGPQTWNIDFDTDQGTVSLSSGGAKLSVDGVPHVEAAKAEYPALYRRFLELTATGESDVDLAPFQLVADAFLLCRRRTVEPFEDGT